MASPTVVARVAWFLACCLVAAVTCRAQDNVGPHEQRFNAGIYKASHNSYDRDESLASQIDNWNCWCVELDLHYYHSDNQIHVGHLCGTFDSGPLLSTKLNEITQSVEQADRVTVIYLELKSACASTPGFPSSWPASPTYRAAIRTAVTNAFGNQVYPSIEFKTTDQYRWPSFQELLRRGYRWIVILDEQETAFSDDDFFFGMARGNPPTAFEANSVLVNSDDDDVVPNRGDQPDRWMFRAYPTPSCGTPDDEDYYDDAIASGYTFVATNCIDHHYTMTPTTHSASPVRVTNGGTGTAFGTLAYPYRLGDGLVQAVQRASPRVPVSIVGGLYVVPRGTQLYQPCILRAHGSRVRIAAP